jgi:dipeptide/tripeptide permease
METGERFAYYGFRAVLTLYFVQELRYTENQAISMFAYTTALAYLSPILGALLADGRWGRYYTIVVFGTVYVLGLVVLTAAACFVDTNDTDNDNNDNIDDAVVAVLVENDHDQLQLKNALTIAGLLLICLGTGGIKPCVSAFGADQVQTTNIDDEPIVTSPTPPAAAVAANSNINEQRGLLRCYNNSNGCGAAAMMVLPDEIELDDFIAESPPDARETTGEILLMDTNHQREEQVRVFFACFYFCINVGAVTSIAIIPTVRGAFGFGAAFFVPTIFMMVAMTLFLSMSHKYVHIKQNGEEASSLSTTFALCWYLLKKNTWPFIPKCMRRCFPCLLPEPTLYMQQHGQQQQKQETTTTTSIPLATLSVNDKKNVADELVTAYNAHHDDDANDYDAPQQQQHRNEAMLEEHLADAKQALRVLPIMALTPLFWMLYDQQSSVWVLQAARMHLPRGIEPEQMNAVNPIQIMIFIPLFDRVLYPFLDQHGFNIRPLRRMAVGMLLCALAFFTSGLLESVIQEREEAAMSAQVQGEGGGDSDGEPVVELVNVFWQVPQITLLSIAEIFVSVTGMEFVYAASPQRLKASLTALFLLTTAVGDFLSGILYSTVFQQLDRVWIMHICGGLMMINLILFIGVAWWWEAREAVRNQQQHHQPPFSTRSRNSKDVVPPTSLSDSKQGLMPVQQGQLA